jgi:hypothetical protein
VVGLADLGQQPGDLLERGRHLIPRSGLRTGLVRVVT